MKLVDKLGALTAAALLLGGCSYTSDTMFASWLDTADPEPAQEQAASADSQSGYTDTGTASFSSATVGSAYSAGFGTGTFVGQKVSQFRGELGALKSTIDGRGQELENIRTDMINNAQNYHSAVGGIRSRLQVGTTPGNPMLMDNWRAAQQQLAHVDGDIHNMNRLSAQVSSDANMSTYLLDSIRAAYSLSGAVEEDHRDLRVLEDETNQTVVLINRLLEDISEDISRQQRFVANERDMLNELAVAINAGSLYGKPRGEAGDLPMASAADFSNRRPLVVVRFDNPNVAFEPALYQAVSRALERRPDAMFDVVAVSPAGPGGQTRTSPGAQRNAESVLKSLNGMGLPSDRVVMSAMSSSQARSSEVHIYVR